MSREEDRQRTITLGLMAGLVLTGVTAFMKSFFWVGYWPHRICGLVTLGLAAMHIRHHWRKVLRYLAQAIGRSRMRW